MQQGPKLGLEGWVESQNNSLNKWGLKGGCELTQWTWAVGKADHFSAEGERHVQRPCGMKGSVLLKNLDEVWFGWTASWLLYIASSLLANKKENGDSDQKSHLGVRMLFVLFLPRMTSNSRSTWQFPSSPWKRDEDEGKFLVYMYQAS